MDLALFDFDGTITTRSTYQGFVRAAVLPGRKLGGGVLLGPLLVGYKSGLVSDATIRRVISKVAFWKQHPARVTACGERYAEDVLPALIRPRALERIAWHKSRGDRVVVVSASLDVYLEPWCRTMGVEVICTRLETRRGRMTGRYLGGDCCGAEKVKRIHARYPRAEYASVHAYGDTEEDRQMLELADHKYFRWKEVDTVPPPSRATRRCDVGT